MTSISPTPSSVGAFAAAATAATTTATAATTTATAASTKPRLRTTAIVPARNEAACIAVVIEGLLALRNKQGQALLHEVLVADNGSTDGTADIARRCGARVIWVEQAGYGRACWEATQSCTGDVFLFVDGDGAADPQDAARLLSEIEHGADLVVGVRECPAPGAMTFTQRWGNALACALMRFLWAVPARDLGPYRAIRRSAFDALHMRDRAFGWTVEMQVRAHRVGLRVAMVPVAWHARIAGESKISGSLRGAFFAGVGILGVIARLWLQESRRPAHETQLFHTDIRAASVAPTSRCAVKSLSR